MRFIFARNISPIIQHDLLRSDIILIYTKVYLFFQDNAFCFINSKFQSLRSISFPSLICFYAVADMSSSFPKRFR